MSSDGVDRTAISIFKSSWPAKAGHPRSVFKERACPVSRRAWEHREGVVEGFTKKYGTKRLVYAAFHEDIRDAIRREHRIKKWPRAWKVRLIHADNPNGDDLYERLNG